MISTNTPTDHIFSILSRNYWETQGAIWGLVLRDLTGNVNETHISIYFRIYLFRVERSGCVSLAELALEKEGRKEGGRRGEGGDRRAARSPYKAAAQAPFTASSTGTAFVCPHIVRLTRGEKKLTKSQIK